MPKVNRHDYQKDREADTTKYKPMGIPKASLGKPSNPHQYNIINSSLPKGIHTKKNVTTTRTHIVYLDNVRNGKNLRESKERRMGSGLNDDV